MIQRRRDRETELSSPTERKIRNQLTERAAKPVTPTERPKATARGAKNMDFSKRHSLIDSNRMYSPQKKGHLTAEEEAARMAEEVAKLQIAMEDSQHASFCTDEEGGKGEDSASQWKFKEENEDDKILSDWKNLDTKMKKGETTFNENDTTLDDEDDYYREVELKMGNKSSTGNEAEERRYKARGGELEIAENIFKFNTDKYDIGLEMNHDDSDDKEEEETAATEVEETEATDEGVSLALEMVEKMLSVEASNDRLEKEEIVPSRRFRESRFHAHETSPFHSAKAPARKTVNETMGESNVDGSVGFDSEYRRAKPTYFGHSDKPKSEILRRPTKRVEDSGFFSLQSSDSLSSRYFNKSPKGRKLLTSSHQKRNYITGHTDTNTSSFRDEAMREDRMTGRGKSIRAYDPSARLSRWQAPQEKKRVI